MSEYTLVADLSIPLRFNGAQPNAYGVERAVSKPVEAGEMVGDTRQGGSVNFEQYTFIPHCNGTHTECVGHITRERISVRDCLQDVLIPALLVTTAPDRCSTSDDLLISGRSIESAIAEQRATGTRFSDMALIVRTLPNDDSKLSRDYGEDNIPPYFTLEAMQLIVDGGFQHLLVDLPSLDRIFDDGKLLNHRMFWNVDAGSFELNAETRRTSTVTELIYIPNDVSDGRYLLNLQIAPFDSDCAPSRPMLLKIN